MICHTQRVRCGLILFLLSLAHAFLGHDEGQFQSSWWILQDLRSDRRQVFLIQRRTSPHWETEHFLPPSEWKFILTCSEVVANFDPLLSKVKCTLMSFADFVTKSG